MEELYFEDEKNKKFNEILLKKNNKIEEMKSRIEYLELVWK